MPRARLLISWSALALALGVPLFAAATSPLLQWRDATYQLAGFAGVLALALLLVQPLLAGRLLPGLSAPLSQRAHRGVGAALVLAVVVHVGGLWVTSPPDVVDALLLDSPTPFSLWGVIAMWAVFATAGLALLRRRWRLRPGTWLLCHGSLATVIVAGTVTHAVLIEGTMGTVSKIAFCVLVAAASGTVLFRSVRRALN
ncbi:MAG: ferric reductase-like transmembrane domain-containing protein [Pseudomonadota bacterium]